MNIKKNILYHLNSFFDAIFPRVCIVCGRKLATSENYICTNCIYEIPRTNTSLIHKNPIFMVFFGRVKIENATSLFYYHKESDFSKLLYSMKYEGNNNLAKFLGSRLGRIIKESSLYSDIDLIIPVPLHPKKQKMRGYNQSEWIAKGVSSVTGYNLSVNNLYRNHFTNTQTKKNRVERWENVRNKFGVCNPRELENKHILLIDDVLTTGATLDACSEVLLSIKGVKISIATLAKA